MNENKKIHEIIRGDDPRKFKCLVIDPKTGNGYIIEQSIAEIALNAGVRENIDDRQFYIQYDPETNFSEMCIDLTMMFGKDKRFETVDEVEKLLYPNQYQAYSYGEA